MWSILNGTIVNVITVTIGSLAGLSISRSLPERYRLIVLQALGLVTVTLGIDAGVLNFSATVARFRPEGPKGATYGATLAMVMILCLLSGVIVGTALRLQERIESLGGFIHRRFSGEAGAQHFAEAFLTASVIFCVGPLTLLGCLQNGAHADPSYLYIKSLLDGFCSMALASSLGWGVLASVVTVGGFQGGLAILAYAVAKPLDDLSIALMTAVGGIVLLATALLLLDLKKIPVANMLPGVFFPPLAVWISESIAPGLLLPPAAP